MDLLANARGVGIVARLLVVAAAPGRGARGASRCPARCFPALLGVRLLCLPR